MPSSSTAPRSLEAFLCFAIYSASHAFNQLYRPLLDAVGLTYPQYLAMTVLWEKDGVTVKELGAALHLESSTLTPLLKRLEGLGYVARRRDGTDERQVRISVTDAGWTLREKAADIPGCIAEAIGLAPDLLIRLRGEITAVRDRLLERAP